MGIASDKHKLKPEMLRDDQRAIANDGARFKVVACGRRWGKTTLGLVTAAQYARRGRRVWWVAPTYGLAFHPWRDLKRAFDRQWARKLESERFIELEGGGTITVKSAEDPNALRGVGLDLVVVDEAAYVHEEAWTAALRPALADRKGKALLISTPRGRNWFFHAFQRGRDPAAAGWASWRFPTSANRLIGEREIEDAQALLPERIFKQEYEAAFVAGGGSVFRQVREVATAPEDAAPQAGHHYVAGVDFGRYHDFTVVCVLDASVEPVMQVALDRFRLSRWGLQRERIAALAARWGARAVLAEANAMGEPNIEALRAAGAPVIPFTTTAASKGPLIERLVGALEAGRLQLLPDEVQMGELEAYTYRVRRHTGHFLYGAPPGLHDDTVIALALAWQLVDSPRLALGIAVG